MFTGDDVRKKVKSVGGHSSQNTSGKLLLQALLASHNTEIISVLWTVVTSVTDLKSTRVFLKQFEVLTKSLGLVRDSSLRRNSSFTVTTTFESKTTPVWIFFLVILTVHPLSYFSKSPPSPSKGDFRLPHLHLKCLLSPESQICRGSRLFDK